LDAQVASFRKSGKAAGQKARADTVEPRLLLVDGSVLFILHRKVLKIRKAWSE
jgi:hypothetical protein